MKQENILPTIKADKDDIYFTSGEVSNNLQVRGYLSQDVFNNNIHEHQSALAAVKP